MLMNAALAGLLASVYLAILFLQVNPHLPLDPVQLWPLLAVVVGCYATLAAAFFYALILVRQLLSTELLSPGWLSLRVLSWLSAIAATAGSVLMWLNLRGLRTALAEEAARRLTVGAVALGLCALALLTIAVVHYSFGRRGSFVGATLFILAVLASVTLPIVARGNALPRALGAYPLDVSGWSVPPRGVSRVVMLLLDGASLDYLSLATAEGRLPSFGRVIDSGAAMHLATLRPTQPGPVWATVATGKYPPRHGVISTSTYAVAGGTRPLELLPDHCFAQALVFLGLLRETPASSASLRSRPLWSMLSSQGVSVGVVGWPLTHPVQPVRGFLISDRFHQIAGGAADVNPTEAAYPEEVFSLGEDAIRGTDGGLASSTALDEEEALAPAAPAMPIWRDRVYDRVTDVLRDRFEDVRFLAVRYRGLDLAGHRFLPAAASLLGGGRGARGDAASLEAYYSQMDEEVAALLDRLAPDDLLIVVSGFGMEPVSMAKRLLAQVVGDPDFTGTHENAPDGFMLAYGSAVEPGRRIRGSVVDVAPTVLYFLGVPVARDIDGVARTDVFTRSFTDSQPITFVRSYDR